MSLTDKQQRFAREFIVDLNATQAAIRAGYSEKTARSQGQRLLTKADVQTAIAALKATRAKKVELKADRVLQEIMHCAFSDLREVLQVVDGVVSVRDLESLPESTTRAIESITQVTTEDNKDVTKVRLTVKMAPKLAALKLLCDHLGLSIQRHEVSGPGGAPIDVEARNAEYHEAMRKLAEGGK